MDISKVKNYVQRQMKKILLEKVNLQDFIFSKEVKLGSYKSELLPPAALVAKRMMQKDPR